MHHLWDVRRPAGARSLRRWGALAGLLVGSWSLPAAAWTPGMQTVIAREAARLAPPDLARQIEKHRPEYEGGVAGPFSDTDAGRHMRNPDGYGSLDRVIAAEAAAAVAAIRGHRPFAEVVARLGTVSHFMADANNPLATSGADAEEGRYFADFLRYAESAEPRLPLVFYGLPVLPATGRTARLPRADTASIVAEALRRGRELYPMIGREYRRIDFASGLGRFDDRSTAFGVASLAFSHAVNDVALVLRAIWLEAGGADERAHLPAAGQRLLVLPRAGR